MANHEKSEWHLAAVERRAFSQSAEKRGDVIELILTASEEEKKENRKMMKKFIRSLYFVVKHHIPHTTTFEGLVTLQIENGDITLKAHRETCPRNATYESYSTIVDLLASISKTLENSLFDSLKGSVSYSIMVDESTYVTSKEELPVCARWLHHKKPVETNAEAIAGYISDATGDAEAHGIAILLTKYKTVACIYMLCYVLHTVAALQASLQAKDIDLASVPAMVESTTKRLMELKENVNTSMHVQDSFFSVH